MDLDDKGFVDKLKIKDIDFDNLKKVTAIKLIKRLIQRLRFYRLVYLFVTSYRVECLNKNLVLALIKISDLVKKDKNGWVHTDFIYSEISKKGSPSGKVSSLLALGLIEHYYTDEEIKDGKRNNGKYFVSQKGYDFLYNNLKVNMKVRVSPKFEIINGDVVKSRKYELIGDLVDIFSNKLKWKTQDDIMEEVIKIREKNRLRNLE